MSKKGRLEGNVENAVKGIDGNSRKTKEVGTAAMNTLSLSPSSS